MTLQEKAAALTGPLTDQRIQEIYNWDSPLFANMDANTIYMLGIIRDLCISHERLRMDVYAAVEIMHNLACEATTPTPPNDS